MGAKTRQTDPDGSSSTSAFKQCSSGCGWARAVSISRDFAPSGSETRAPSVSYTDSLGREVLAQGWGFDGSEIRAEKEYDAQRRLARSARAHFTGEAPVWTTYEQYDDLGRNTRVTTPDGTSTTTYAGLVTSYTNPKNQTRSETRNALGQIKANTDPAGKSASYAYDPFGNVLRSTDPLGNVIAVGYDGLGRRTSLSDPDLGARSYRIDALGQIYSQTDAKGQVTTFDYDDLGRMTRRLEPDLDSRWVYDTAAMGVGQLAEAYTVNGTGAKDYRRVHGYDALGRPSSTVITLDKDHASTLGYDAAGRVASETHEVRTIGAGSGTGHSFSHAYNGLGFLERISEGGTVHWQVQAQDALGNVTQGRHANGVVTKRSYNPQTARLEGIAGIHPTTGQASIQNDGYGYDPLGNLLSRTQLTGGGTLQETFGYDSLNRVTSAQVTGQAQKTFGYDDIGNLVSKGGVGGYTYPASGAASVRPHAVVSITGTVNGVANPGFSYDNNGNLLSGAGRSYTWTSYDRPQQITLGSGANLATDTFLHGPEHQRTRQIRAKGSPAVTQSTVYYAGAIEREVRADGSTVTKTYLPQNLGVIQDTQVGSGTTTAVRTFHHDHLGSVVAISDEAANVVERLSYDAWGLRRNLDGSDDAGLPPNQVKDSIDTKGYTGHEHLDDVKLVHMNGRVYDPVVGRFTSADPMVSDTEPSQGSNRYSYVLNNPLAFTDPTGLEEETASNTDAQAKGNESTQSSGPKCSPGMGGCTINFLDAKAFENALRGELRQINKAYRDLQAKEFGGQGSAEFWAKQAEAYEQLLMRKIAVYQALGEQLPLGLIPLDTARLHAKILAGATIEKQDFALMAGVAMANGMVTAPTGGKPVAKGLPDSALVCRGGLCTADRFAGGSGVKLDAAGKMSGASVNSAADKTLKELSVTIPNPKLGVTTVGDIRRAGGDVVLKPTPNNPYHCEMCGITPQQAERLFTPVVPNPNR